MFMHSSGEYANPNRTEDEKNKMFIERAESVISAEGSKYYSIRQKVAEDSKK